MNSVKISFLLGATLMGFASASTAVRAADMPQAVYPVAVQPLPQVQEFQGWYLRGDIGYSALRASSLEYSKNPGNPPNDFVIEHFTMSDTYFFGLGVGYEFNNMFRFDVTGEYRATSGVFAFGRYTDGAGGVFLDVFNGHAKSWLVLANAYVDLGTWWCITPFVGVGLGGAYNTLTLSDFGPQTGGRGWSDEKAEWNFAYALHAGFSYAVTQNFKVELAYRYLDLGSATSSILCVGGCLPDSYKLNSLTANEVKLALRWSLYDGGSYAPPPPQQVYVQPQAPVYAPPPPVYSPPPVYQQPPPYQPPLMRKG